MLSVAAGGLLLGHIEKRILGQEVPLWPKDLARGIAREQNRGLRKSVDPHLVPQQGDFICSYEQNFPRMRQHSMNDAVKAARPPARNALRKLKPASEYSSPDDLGEVPGAQPVPAPR